MIRVFRVIADSCVESTGEKRPHAEPKLLNPRVGCQEASEKRLPSLGPGLDPPPTKCTSDIRTLPDTPPPSSNLLETPLN